MLMIVSQVEPVLLQENSNIYHMTLFSPMQNLKQLERGCCHLRRQVENAQAFGLPVIVAVNKFRYNISQQKVLCVHFLI